MKNSENKPLRICAAGFSRRALAVLVKLDYKYDSVASLIVEDINELMEVEGCTPFFAKEIRKTVNENN